MLDVGGCPTAACGRSTVPFYSTLLYMGSRDAASYRSRPTSSLPADTQEMPSDVTNLSPRRNRSRARQRLCTARFRLRSNPMSFLPFAHASREASARIRHRPGIGKGLIFPHAFRHRAAEGYPKRRAPRLTDAVSPWRLSPRPPKMPLVPPPRVFNPHPARSETPVCSEGSADGLAYNIARLLAPWSSL